MTREREERIRYLYQNDLYFHEVVDTLIQILKDTPLTVEYLHDAVNLAEDIRRKSYYIEYRYEGELL